MARARTIIGFGVPKSLQECPPGPRAITSKRRLPRASATTVSEPAPSTAGAARNHLKAAAAKGLRDHRVGAGAIDDDAVSNGIPPAWRLKNMTHAAQIAFAFFSYIADKQERQSVRNR